MRQGRRPARARRAHAQHDRAAAYLYASETIDGTVAISGQLDPVGGEIVTNELNRIIENLKAQDAASGVERTLAQLRAAALVEMAKRSAAMPGDARFSRPLFTVMIGDDRFREACELAGGAVITPHHLVPYLTDAMYEVLLFDGPHTVVSVSNKRLFTGALRRAIEDRVTAIASTRQNATNPPTTATSTTSSPPPGAAPRRSSTAGWSARSTTATRSSTTTAPDRSPNARSTSWTCSAPASDGACVATTPTS